LYKDGDERKPVDNQSLYQVSKLDWSAVTFLPVKTKAMRLEVDMEKKSVGLYEWKVVEKKH